MDALKEIIPYVLATRPGVNFMSQKLRGIPPGGILLLTLIETFPLFFFLGVNSALLNFTVIISSKLESKCTLSQKNVEKSLLKLKVKFLLVEFLLTFDS